VLRRAPRVCAEMREAEGESERREGRNGGGVQGRLLDAQMASRKLLRGADGHGGHGMPGTQLYARARGRRQRRRRLGWARPR